jgi:hypothetical protein
MLRRVGLNSGARDGLVFSGNNAGNNALFLREGSTTTFILRDQTRIPNTVSDNSNQGVSAYITCTPSYTL